MKNNSKLIKNAIFLAFRTIVITFVGLYSVRELLNLLGVDGFGVFNLIFGVAVLFSFLNGALISSSQRYLSYYLGEKNEVMLRQVWNNSVFLHFIIAILISLFLFLFKDKFLLDILVIPKIYLNISNIIYYCSIFSIFISVLQAPFSALVLAHERMSFFAIISLVDAALKLIIIYALYFLNGDNLYNYSILYCISVFFIFVVYNIYVFIKFKENLIFKVRNISLLKEMLSFSIWSIFGNLAFVSKTQGINILLNIFVGVIANSSYTLTSNITSAVNNLVNSVITAINPQIYKTYAEKNYERNIILIHKSSKFSFFLGVLIVLPIIFNTNYILNIIFNENPTYLIDFVQLALLIVLIDCLSGSIMTGIQATGHIKMYQLGISFLIFLNLPLSYFVLKEFSNPNLVYWIGILISSLSFILRVIFLKRLIIFSIHDYFRNVILRILMMLIPLVISIFVFNYCINISNVHFDFLINLFFIWGISVFYVIIFGLDKEEKYFTYSKLLNILK